MINIISTQARANKISGPFKVFKNLIKGLNKIGYPYVINRDLNATKRLWIQDDITALRYMHRSKAYKVVGPNLFVMPSDIPANISFDATLYLQPCGWVKQLWGSAGFNSCPIVVCPVGIDTDEFQPLPVPDSERRVMVYHKGRDVQELVTILETLHTLHLPYRLMLYGRYTEAEYKQALRETSFIVWHGCHESQGIALQEAMACDIPVLVCDVTSLSQARGGDPFPASFHSVFVTAAPYFDATCGLRIMNLEQLPETIGLMQDNLTRFQPRQFIVDHLSLESQACKFIKLWEHWNLTPRDGLNEVAETQHTWSEPLVARFVARAKRSLYRTRVV